MVRTNEQSAIQVYKHNRAFVIQEMYEFQTVVTETISSEKFMKAAAALLPFDKIAGTRIKFMNDDTIVKSIGIALMKMDLEPTLFSLGISIEISDTNGNDNEKTTIFIVAAKSYDEIKEYVKGEAFMDTAKYQFERQIKKYCIDGIKQKQV